MLPCGTDEMRQAFTGRPFFAQNGFFSLLTEEHWRILKPGLSRIRVPCHETLFLEGEEATRFFYLINGRIKLYRLSKKGREKVLHIAESGQTFAEAVMFLPEKFYPVSATALCHCEVVCFSHEVFLKVLENSPALCMRMLQDFSIRLYRHVGEIEKICLGDATGRLVRYLLDQMDDDQVDGEGPVSIKLDAPKHAIASCLSMQPASLSRILNRLSGKGLIQIKGKMVEVPDVKALRRRLTACAQV